MDNPNEQQTPLNPPDPQTANEEPTELTEITETESCASEPTEQTVCVPEEPVEPTENGKQPNAEQFSFDALKPKIKPIHKVLFMVLLLTCIGVSLYFSFDAVALDTFEFSENETGWTLDGFHNTGSYEDLVLDCIYEQEGSEWVASEEKKITKIRTFALTCDETVKRIYIGASVTEIGDEAFYSCKNLEAVFVDENNPAYTSENGILYNKDKTVIIQFPINYINYEGNTLKQSAEDGTEEMSYTLPDTVVSVAPTCFAYAKNLVEVNLGRVETLNPMSFFECSSLRKVVVSENLKTIGADAFSYCKKLTYFYVPKSVTVIDHHAFYEDSNLEYIALGRTKEEFKEVETGDYWHSDSVSKKLDVKYGETKREGY